MTHLYFEWLYQLVCGDRRRSFRRLLSLLFNIDFFYILDMDSNRGTDGLDLRYRFCYEHKYEYSELSSELSDKPCSVLEVMIALALRFEEQIMDDPDIGNRMPIWFHEMLNSLGLENMDDRNFDESRVREAIDIFLYREYSPDGLGGLFYIPNCNRDLRNIEIWYQACWFFDRQL